MSDEKSRQQVFDFIVTYKQQHDGLAPAFKDIALGCALSESTVRYHIMMLQIEKRIRVVGRRAIEVIGGEWNYDE
ncbi:MAG: hypothetical protein JW966_04645 [Anaerolineae bacterium]|nr:hypothetical protein [Anaerolineae bacterium]